MKDYKDVLKKQEYQFLKEINSCYLVMAGSIAYGTNNENSDVDIRGCYLDNPCESFHMEKAKKEEIEDSNTDTVVYALRKYARLLCQCNPNTIESLGVKDEHVLYINDIGKMLRSNRKMFLSKKAYITFAQYANAQLRRLENALARDTYEQNEKEKHIMKSIEAQMMNAKNEYKNYDKVKKLNFEIKSSDKKEYDSEIYLDINVESMPLRDFLRINSDMSNMIRNYGKLNKRNHKKDFNHLCKHAMHLIRLYYMGIDIIKNHEIITYRENEHDFLMAVRNGLVSFDEVFAKQRELEKIMNDEYEKTTLPDEPMYDKINAMLEDIYMSVIRGEMKA